MVGQQLLERAVQLVTMTRLLRQSWAVCDSWNAHG